MKKIMKALHIHFSQTWKTYFGPLLAQILQNKVLPPKKLFAPILRLYATVTSLKKKEKQKFHALIFDNT